MSIAWNRLARIALLLALGAMAACGGGDSTPASGPGPVGNPPANPPANPSVIPPASQQGTGNATVVVTDPDGEPLINASVSVFDEWTRRYLPAGFTGPEGTVTFPDAPNWLRVSVVHGLGYRQSDTYRMAPGASVRIVVAVEPRDLVSVAMLPARIPAASLNADRTELTVQLALVSDSTKAFQRSSYGSPQATPMVRIGDCWTWLEPQETRPVCRYVTPAGVEAVSLRYYPAGTVAWSGVTDQRSTLLMLDQSTRTADYDPDQLRWFGAGKMLQRITMQATAGGTSRLAFAGFSSTAGGTLTPLHLPAPAWEEPDLARGFLADVAQQRATLTNLQAKGGGFAQLVPALQAATDLIAAHAPAGSRALIAMTGGADSVSSSIAQQDHTLTSRIAPAQRAAGIRSILVTGQLPEDSPERARLAQMAAMLDATMIFGGYPADWRHEFNPFDGLHTALLLAADITAGTPLPTIETSFRIRTDAARPFVSGELFEGTLYIETDLCPMGCAEIPLAFAARIP